jgi:hypothetical protein
VHFYTISEAEKQHIIANLKSFNFEGVAYHASVLPGTGYTPLYRFFLPSRGYHFYTASQQERDHIIANLRQYTYEGIGYYVLDSQWRMPDVAPITEEIHDVCLQAGTSAPLSCTNPATAQLYPQQDGHRLPPFDPVNNPLIKLNSVGVVKDNILPECVFDESTGLLWENHTASAGIHNYLQVYTNLNNGLYNDTSGHVAAVNAARLCGFSDWRLPTLQELHTLVDYGVKSDVFGRKRTKTFPHILLWTPGATYWTSTTVNESGVLKKGVLNFSNGGREGDYVATSPGLLYFATRLVRGDVWQGPRYVVTTKAFGGDAPNNAVVDTTTGLTWRRCEGEYTWDGVGCSNPSELQTHEQALLKARTVWEQNPGWRMPNIQELYSAYGPVGASPFALDPNYFDILPDRESVDGPFTWTTTPVLQGPQPTSLYLAYRIAFRGIERSYSFPRNRTGGRTRYVWTAN